MNYSPIFTLAASTERAYDSLQLFISEQAPVIEARLEKWLKAASLRVAVKALTITLFLIDWAIDRYERRHEYRLQIQLATVKTKRFLVRLLIRLVKADERYRVTATARDIWNRKGSIAVHTFDTIFALK